MTQKSVAKPNGNAAVKVVVFGCDEDGKPYAAWFPKAQADQARAAAKHLHLNVVEVTNGTAADLIGKLAPGRIHATGTGAVPTVHDDVYEKIVARLNPRGEAGKEPGQPTVTDLPATWDAIKPGHLVLIQEKLAYGWWEAIVVSRAGDKLTLRMRDYPHYAKFTRSVTEVALLNPKAA